MRKFITIITTLLCVTVAGTAQKSKTITVTGKVSGDTKGYNDIVCYSRGNSTDTVKIKNGQFLAKFPFSETYIQLFYAEYEKQTRGMYLPYPLLIDGSGDVHIDMDITKGFYEANVTGAPSAMAYHGFLKTQSEARKKVADELLALYGVSTVRETDPLAARYLPSKDSLTKLYIGGAVLDFVTTHKNEYVGLYVLYTVGKSSMNIDTLEKVLQLLAGDLQQKTEGQELAAFITGVKNTSIGNTVKNFVLNDPEGRPVSFDQFKGKYVWIDFWASWCAPCKAAFPHMKDLYAKYKDKGFEIIGISTDKKIEPWLKILPKLQNPWPQVWDDKNIMSDFAVTAFPTSFLIDPEGKIVLKEVGYEPSGLSAMDKKLAEIFDAANGSANNSAKKESTGVKVVSGTPMMKAQTPN